MAAVPSQQNQPQQQILVETKFFDISLERSAGLLKEAIEHAIGVTLDELASGMWVGRKELEGGHFQDYTVRALPTDDGTSVEVMIEDRWAPGKVALNGTLMMIASMFIVPIFFIVARISEMQRKLARERMLQMHRIWTEVTSTVGAPKRAGYRDRPQRVRTRAPELEEPEEVEVVGEPAKATSAVD